MQLPLKLQIEAINSNNIYLFKNKEFDKSSPSHYHIAIPTKNNNFICFVFFTSKVEKKREFYQLTNPKAYECLIDVKANSFDFISKNSLIDCNQPIYKSKEELEVIIDGDITVVNSNLGISFIDEIREKILKSPIVKPFIKNELKC